MSKGESKWAKSLYTGGEKAPVTMLAEHQDQSPDYPSVWTQLGAQDPSKAAQGLMTSNDNL